MLGTGVALAYDGADGDGDTTIDEGDYSVWTTRFGQTLPGSGGSGAAESADEPVVGIAPTALEAAVVLAQEIPIENQATRRLRRPPQRVELRGIAIPAARDDGFIAWLAGLDREQQRRRTELGILASSDDTESTSAGTEAAIDDVFSLSDPSAPWWSGSARGVSFATSFCR
jgi:hypothetical protein